jgi:ubiquinone/menaquinone biosynthesis C-methylase UbiE
VIAGDAASSGDTYKSEAMGFYARHVLPRLINFAMANEEMARLRANWIRGARGEVFEVGIGSGLNLPFYTFDVKCIRGVDPSIELQRMARERVSKASVPVEFYRQSAEQPVPLPDESVDTVVVTWTLCSIPNASRALEQARRVLKRDGQFIFVEHGRAPDPAVAAWQDRLTPLWMRIGGGCHLNRKVDAMIEAAGFQIVDLKTCYLPGLRPMTYTYQGIARKV